MENLKLNFTGKMTILFEIEDHGPMEWRINDHAITMEICRILLNKIDDTLKVNSYNDTEEKQLRDLLNFE